MTQSAKILEYIKTEYQRCLREAGHEDPYIGETTIGIHEVLRAHFLLAEFFASTGEGMGGLGPKDWQLSP